MQQGLVEVEHETFATSVNVIDGRQERCRVSVLVKRNADTTLGNQTVLLVLVVVVAVKKLGLVAHVTTLAFAQVRVSCRVCSAVRIGVGASEVVLRVVAVLQVLGVLVNDLGSRAGGLNCARRETCRLVVGQHLTISRGGDGSRGEFGDRWRGAYLFQWGGGRLARADNDV